MRKGTIVETAPRSTVRRAGRRNESGQATAEYALVLVAAAIVALALITWASSTDMLPSFFNTVMQKVISVANGVG
jgi:Flp pilus assembly pilin Flp